MTDYNQVGFCGISSNCPGYPTKSLLLVVVLVDIYILTWKTKESRFALLCPPPREILDTLVMACACRLIISTLFKLLNSTKLTYLSMLDNLWLLFSD